ncbi:MAG: type II toxin-antitoxin system VapC family toxin [Euryarchaeota archaeon]|nr:type II toxin-antitoxin system VapC family toxin [Euryarchaeota archaeon]MBU4492103.1 type II toxin-antitoxin system VapC family toxin [Euryarchaeota archaeon]MCG2712923.1 type II toxin-antitoxin system VapC family toxin [Candidatus Omnitrophota bacterium]
MRVYKPKVCIDTSAIVKWFRVEKGSDEALKLREWIEKQRINLVFSMILLSECARGLKKAEWNDSEIYEALDMLDTIIELCRVEVVPIDGLIIKSAQNLVVDYGLYSADAIHSATAILTESNYFISSDEHHFKEELRIYMEEGMKSCTRE